MSLNPIFFNFKGTTNIYTITDTHQDTRKTRTVLSEVVNKAKKQKNVLLLNCGDMFKGIYPRELEADSFVKAKELAPELEIVTTLGNNDLGFNEQHLKYLISTIKKFSENGIKTVCANLFDKNTGKRPEWLSPYVVVERDGDKNFITGFCINNINSNELSVQPVNQELVLDEIDAQIVVFRCIKEPACTGIASVPFRAEEEGDRPFPALRRRQFFHLKGTDLVIRKTSHIQRFSGDSLYEFDLPGRNRLGKKSALRTESGKRIIKWECAERLHARNDQREHSRHPKPELFH